MSIIWLWSWRFCLWLWYCHRTVSILQWTMTRHCWKCLFFVFRSLCVGSWRNRSHWFAARNHTWTSNDFIQANEQILLVSKTDSSAHSVHYGVIIRYELSKDSIGWENEQLAVAWWSNPSPDGMCMNLSSSDDCSPFIVLICTNLSWTTVMSNVYLEDGISYELYNANGWKAYQSEW